MCLIIHRPNGCIIPDSLIANGIADNPHGWGIMAAYNGRIRAVRGIDPAKFRAALKKFDDQEVFIHFRYATHGPKNESNCHPFIINGGGFAIMHNGVIWDVKITRKDRSDTWHYATKVLAPMLSKDPDLILSPEFAADQERLLGSGNKVVILRRDGASVVLNRHLGTEYDGCWLSNSRSLNRQTWYDGIDKQLSDDWEPWYQDDMDLEALARLGRDELIETCELYPDLVADAIRDYFLVRSSRYDWR